MLTERHIRATASHAIGLEVLRRCARALVPHGIYAMPLKGLWLQSYVYERPEERVITDVDVIVPDRAFGIAQRALRAAGFVARSTSVAEVAMAVPDLPLPLDLHAHLFMPGAFALPTQTLFRRASAPVALEGSTVVLPEPLDALCHLVGHFVKSRTAPDDTPRTRDFSVVVQRFSLTSGEIAARLEATGMARAARYAFADVAQTDLVLAEALVALPHDPAGELIARACVKARSALSSAPKNIPLLRVAHALPGFLLERSLSVAGRALLQRAVSLSADRAHT
jgi:hypothetical protein